MKFSEMKYERPDLDKVLAQCEEYAKKMAAAQSGEELVQLYREENAMMAHYHTASCLASIHYTQDTRDEYWSGEQEWFDATGPAVSNAARNVAEAILSNPHAKALEEAFGTRILPSLRNLVLSMDDRVIELQKEENALTSAYQKLYGGAMAELDGKQLTIPQLTLYKQSTDPAMRRKAYEAEAVYFDAHRAEFDEIYDKMVKNRNEQARILGYNDYSELSYIRMNRIGYGPAEVAAFRQEVVEQVVPMIQKALALRNKRTGIENPMFWDSTISFADGNPVPHGSYDELMAGARKMYHELSPETAEFIDFMQDNEMFDVLSRPGKMSEIWLLIHNVLEFIHHAAVWQEDKAVLGVQQLVFIRILLKEEVMPRGGQELHAHGVDLGALHTGALDIFGDVLGAAGSQVAFQRMACFMGQHIHLWPRRRLAAPAAYL